MVKEGGKKVHGTKEAVERLRLTPPHLEHTTGGESPRLPPLPGLTHHHQHLSIQAVKSLVGRQEVGGGLPVFTA